VKERKFAGFILIGVSLGCGIALGAVFAGHDPLPERKARDWFDFLDIGLRIATLCVFLGGLVGTFAVLTSLRASAYSQMYSRFQALHLKFAEHPDWFDRMRAEEFIGDDAGPTPPYRFAANALVNLYEEAFMLSEAKVLAVFDLMPDDYWVSMVESMKESFRLRYVRTHWERRQACYTPTFNRFVKEQILGSGEA
jgi:hypothetical protein